MTEPQKRLGEARKTGNEELVTLFEKYIQHRENRVKGKSRAVALDEDCAQNRDLQGTGKDEEYEGEEKGCCGEENVVALLETQNFVISVSKGWKKMYRMDPFDPK